MTDQLFLEALALRREQIQQDVMAGLAQLDAGQFVEGEKVFHELRRKAKALAARDEE